jgi:ABC transporter substrate binding protein
MRRDPSTRADGPQKPQLPGRQLRSCCRSFLYRVGEVTQHCPRFAANRETRASAAMAQRIFECGIHAGCKHGEGKCNQPALAELPHDLLAQIVGLRGTMQGRFGKTCRQRHLVGHRGVVRATTARSTVGSTPTLNPSMAAIVEQTKAAAKTLGVEIHVVELQAPDQFESAFAAVTRARPGALIVLPSAVLYGQHPRIVTFTTASHLAALFPEKEVAEAGGLLAYGPSIPASFRRAAAYVDKILRGAKPADLPVEQPTKFELVVNLQTARAIGITIPTSILLRADEVID